MTHTTHARDYPAPQLFIDGEWTDGTSGRSEPVLNPATGREIGRVPHASAADLDRAAAAAARAIPAWATLSAADRGRVLAKAQGLIRDRAAEIARIATLEQGKHYKEALGEVTRASGTLSYYAEEAKRAYGRIIPVDPGTILTVRHQPVGPVAAFVPWNFPSGGPLRKLSPALAAGCTLVIKCSEETPATACAIVRALADAGLPAGVVNLVFGDPPMISEVLIADPRIRMVAFTGSVPVGKRIAGLAAAGMKPCIMELGGHAPVIVCDDADPVLAARRSAAGKFVNAGQVCTSPSRFLVHDSLFDAFADAFVAAARALTVGDGLDDGVTMGPMANARRIEAMERMVADAVARGARVLTGGKRMGNAGFFFEPTVLADVPPDAELVQIEPFGPVAPLRRFTDLDAALAEANATPYGLAAYAFTRSAATAERLAAGLEAGILSINHTGGSVHEAPSGGVKESGYGREGGPEGLDNYLYSKRVSHLLT
jgi:succinate-semialdehyde dehydrogenase / glutarate-semialdehyde dehydrogenase